MGKYNRKPSFSRKDSRVQFDKGSFKKSKRPNPNFEKLSEDFDAEETLYRILCPVKKIGSVIGKGGDIIKRLREETHAKIKVDDPVPGTDERVVIIFSSSSKIPKISDSTENQEDPENNAAPEETHDEMEPHCPAQHALLKVHERIAEDDGLFGRPAREENNEDDVVTARILVPSNQVGCLLGKGGHVIQKLRTETGANIRILPEDHLPPCAMRTDELVQISGVSDIVKKALYVVSSLLYQNPRPPMKNPGLDQGFYPPGGPMGSMPPEGHPMSYRNSGFHGPPPIPWGGDVPRFPPPGNVTAEFSMKILCPAERIGVVIGKGGSTVRQIQHETGTHIQVEDTNPDAEERAILVSSFDAPWHPISPTIEAILLLQVQTNVISADGTITTRLLVPSSKVGCLLGQGGHIINEMRRRTRADIRVISKDGKPSYASPDEELVQISGNVNVARDALAEVSSRLRMRSLEGINGGVEPGPPVPFNGAGRRESFSERRQPPPAMYGARGPGGYENVKGFGRDFGAQSYSAQPNTGFPNMSSSMKVKIPNSAINSVLGVGGSNISNIGQMSGAKVKLNDPQAGGSECVVEIHGSFEQMSSAQNLLQKFISSSSQNFNSHQHAPYSSAQNTSVQPQPSPYASALPKYNPQQQQNTYPSSWPNSNAQQNQNQSPYASAMPNIKSEQYQNQSPYASAMPSIKTEQYQNPYSSAVSGIKTEQHQSPYASAMQSVKSEQHPSSYASAMPSVKTEQHQSPYGSAQNYNAQQHQSPYGSSVQNYNSQQQQQHQSSYGSAAQNYSALAQQQQHQSSYGSAVQNYSAQAQQQLQPNQYASAVSNYNAYQQQQQSPYASVAPNYNAQQQDQSSYASATQNYDGQQQQGSYQY